MSARDVRGRASYAAVGRAIRQAQERARAKDLSLADRELLSAIVEGVASYSRLADAVTHAELIALSGLSRRAVQAGLARLVEAGCVVYEPGLGAGNPSVVGLPPAEPKKAHGKAPFERPKRRTGEHEKGAQRARVYRDREETREEGSYYYY